MNANSGNVRYPPYRPGSSFISTDPDIDFAFLAHSNSGEVLTPLRQIQLSWRMNTTYHRHVRDWITDETAHFGYPMPYQAALLTEQRARVMSTTLRSYMERLCSDCDIYLNSEEGRRLSSY